MLRIAYGVLNLKPAEFWDMSFVEFWMLYEGWDIRRQYELEHTRLLSATMYTTAFGAKKATKPEQLFRLPEIDKKHTPAYSRESMDAFIQRMSKKAGLPDGQLIQLVKVQKE